jgi:alcohol dehydrogenase (cytochrome c)/quinohemoprotein ethanol dehydrogenase
MLLPVRVALAALVVSSAAGAASGPVDAARLNAADGDAADWMSYGRTYSEQRYSPLTQVNRDTAHDLGLAWHVDLETTRGQEATPLVIDGTMYVAEAWNIVTAYDAATGRLLWRFDPKVPKNHLVKICCDAVSRGLAAWGGRIYSATLDGRLIALDAATGQPVWSVMTIDPTKPYAVTMAPRIVKGRVLIGASGGEFGVRGYLSAYDAATGALDWRFYTVPGDPALPAESPAMAMATKTWSGEWWRHGGGGTVWDSTAYDPALNLVYFGTGNGSEWTQRDRSPGGGDNLFTASIIAVNAETGAYVWHYQTTPGDVWDYDSTPQLILADLPIAGTTRKVVMQANKNGFFYVLDRATGKLVSAQPFAPVTWASAIDLATGRPIEAADARFEKTGKQAMLSPGPAGAHTWQPMSFNPGTGLVYIPEQETAFPYQQEKHFKDNPIGLNLGVELADTSMPADTKIRRSVLDSIKGNLVAWDPVAQKEVWRVAYKGPWNGGTLTTAGNLVFEGDAAGIVHAYSADHGAALWSFDAQSAVMAGPMSYTADGVQYVAVLAGWGGAFALNPGILSGKSGNLRNISRVLVFKLGGTDTLPPPGKLAEAPLDPPPSTADAATIATGKAIFGRVCAACHGDAAIAGGIVPDLRHSVYLKDDGWFDIVLKGSLDGEGMSSFAAILDHDKAAALRAYVIQRANEDKALAMAGEP